MKYFKKIGPILIAIVIVWVSGSLFVLFQTPSVLFQNQSSKTLKLNYGNFEQNWVNNSQGQRISLWYFAQANNKTILYLHGNGGRSANIIASLNTQANVLSVAYPGYHESEGKPSVDGTYEAAEIAYNWLVNEKKIEEKNITILGHSMGGSPAVYLATRKTDAKQLVIINTFSSVQSMCFNSFWIFCALNGDYFNSASLASGVTIPIRQFAYKNDDSVPFEEGQKLYNYFNKSGDKQFIVMNKGTHNNPDFDQIFQNTQF